MEKTPPERVEKGGTSRLWAVDALRGLIIVFMALDHANYFVAQKHSTGEYFGGAFPVYEDTLAFMTRFVTHLSAPGFFFLMGVGMLLFAESRQKRDWSRWAVIRHFLIRGAILIALQLLVVNRAWELSPWGFPSIYIGVLVALGGSMVIGSLLLWLKPVHLLVLGTALFIGTELLAPAPELWDNLQFSNPFDYLNLILVTPGGNGGFWSNYPLLPWLELVVFGILFGSWLKRDQKQAYNGALKIGIGLLLAFVMLRYLDGFGNIRPRAGDTWIDFLNLVKYPPSMAFTLLTMGLNLIVLGAFARVNEKIQIFFYPLVVFGRSPLFFYVLHLFLYAALGMWFTPRGTSIAAMYPYWLLGLLLLFPLCILYERLKVRSQMNAVLRYL